MKKVLFPLFILLSYVMHAQSDISMVARIKKTGKSSYTLYATVKMPKGKPIHPCSSCEIGGWDDNVSPTRFEVYIDTNWNAKIEYPRYGYKGKSTRYVKGSYESKRMKIKRDKYGKKDTLYIPYKEKTREVICQVQKIRFKCILTLEESELFKNKRLLFIEGAKEDETKRQKRQREKDNKRIQKGLYLSPPRACLLFMHYEEGSRRKMVQESLLLPRYK